MIAAINQDGIIGINNQLPWNVPEDLKRFRALTSGGTIIMGRKTFDSIGRPLPNRRNLVLSRSMEPKDKVEVFPNFTKLLLEITGLENVWVIGGAEIYKMFLEAEAVDGLDLTMVDFPIEDKTNAVYLPQIPNYLKEVSSAVNETNPKLKHIKYER